MKSSTTTTRQPPTERRRSTRFDPIKPAPPVTRMLFIYSRQVNEEASLLGINPQMPTPPRGKPCFHLSSQQRSGNRQPSLVQELHGGSHRGKSAEQFGRLSA